jgi:hypothetical protein
MGFVKGEGEVKVRKKGWRGIWNYWMWVSSFHGFDWVYVGLLLVVLIVLQEAGRCGGFDRWRCEEGRYGGRVWALKGGDGTDLGCGKHQLGGTDLPIWMLSWCEWSPGRKCEIRSITLDVMRRNSLVISNGIRLLVS